MTRLLQETFEKAADAAQLRDYQLRDVQEIEEALERTRKVLYCLPTGGGKTVIATNIIERAVERGERVLVLTHRREILRQTSFKLAIEHGLIQAGLNIDLDYPVQVASIQTLWARCMRTDKMSLPPADLIVVDEAHHVRAGTWSKILAAYPNAKVLGLTATPCRGDGRGLGNHFACMVVGPQIPELIASRYLVPTIYYAPSTPNLKGVETRQGDYVVSQLSKRMDRPDLIGDIVTHKVKFAPGLRTIVFCCDVAHSLHACEEFNKAGIKAEHVSGETPKVDRDSILRRLESGETEVVSNCMVLTEGFDCPPVGCIVLARPTKQLGLFRQMAGRGLRPAPAKDKLILIDHSGAVYKHGLLEDPVEWTLEVDECAVNREHDKRSQQEISRLIECSQCGALRKGGEACPSCGFLPRRPSDAIIFSDGDLQRVGAAAQSQTLDREEWFRQLKTLRDVRNGIRVAKGQEPLKPGWVAAKFKDKFGHWPPFSWNGLQPATAVSAEVSASVRSRDIAYAKRMSRNAA